jgi:superfamily I DNA and RNA helicase
LKAKIRLALGDAEVVQTVEKDGMLTVSHFNDLMWRLPVTYQKIGHFDSAERARRYRIDLLDLKSSDPKQFDSCLFDVLFVDEGQDFLPEEYELLREIIRPHSDTGEKPIVIFFDNAQNVYGRPQPTWSDVGIDVARGDRTRVMTECFRNTKQILEVAFNVLYGSHAGKAVHTRQFLDLETLNKGGHITEGNKAVRVHFSKREGAEPIIKRFASVAHELAFVAEEVRRLVVDEHVRPSDILILFVNDYPFKDLPEIISAKPGLSERIQGYLRIYGDTSAKDEYIIQEGHLTLATIQSAKGYDSPVVFMMGSQGFDSGKTKDRALFYVGATRAKHRLYLTGLKYGNDNLLAESRDVDWTLRSMDAGESRC